MKIGFFFIDLIARLPLGVLYVLSDLLCPILHHVVRYRLKVVRKNLSKAFPEKSEKERREIERRFYRYFCDMFFEVIKGKRMSADEFRRRVTFTNTELLTSTLGPESGHDFCTCYLGHFGNWEWLVSLPLSLTDVGMAQIYHPLRNKPFDRWMLDLRSRWGAVNIPMKHTLRRLMQLRKEMQGSADVVADAAPGTGKRGFLLGCIADQLPKRENVHHTVSFLGQPSGVFTGSEKIGMMLGTTFAYARVERPRRGYYRISFVSLDAYAATKNVEETSSTSESLSPFPVTDAYFRLFEEDIRRAPHLWLWTHDRWKR